MCGVDFILQGQNMGNGVVKPYKIITKGEVVFGVVTGSLHDNFLLLENNGGHSYTLKYSLCVVHRPPGLYLFTGVKYFTL